MTKGMDLCTDMEAGGGVNGRSFLGGQLDALKRAGSGPPEEERGLTRFRGILVRRGAGKGGVRVEQGRKRRICGHRKLSLIYRSS